MIYGQITNVMSPLIIPWAFVMLESGVRTSKPRWLLLEISSSFLSVLSFPSTTSSSFLLQDRVSLSEQGNKGEKKKLNVKGNKMKLKK